MNGNVFQMAEEARKPDQYTKTVKALAKYTAIEVTHTKDLVSLFTNPFTEPDLPEPDESREHTFTRRCPAGLLRHDGFQPGSDIPRIQGRWDQHHCFL